MNPKTVNALIAGLAGAIVVNILNETMRRFDDDAPRLEKLGMDAANKLLDKAGQSAPTGDKLYWGTLAADLLTNSLYYATAVSGTQKAARTTGMGLLAGLGSLFLPKKLGLITAPTTRTTKTKVMSTTYYLLGSWVAGMVAETLSNKKLFQR
ncbi:MAG: hypothetical protein EOP52_02690 [Sphingobacteriales bacterium]|nr:MAG: hypothetical protein EOP52_02690 [Sphingobacteriales bacterium]